MVLTVLEATVAPERAADLQAAFRNAAAQVPPGLVREPSRDRRRRLDALAHRDAVDEP
jgi:hypothetical protein